MKWCLLTLAVLIPPAALAQEGLPDDSTRLVTQPQRQAIERENALRRQQQDQADGESEQPQQTDEDAASLKQRLAESEQEREKMKELIADQQMQIKALQEKQNGEGQQAPPPGQQ